MSLQRSNLSMNLQLLFALNVIIDEQNLAFRYSSAKVGPS